MKQDKIAQLEQTEKLIQLGEKIWVDIKPLIFEGEEFDDRINLDEDISQEIIKDREKIEGIDEKKEEISLKIIGQLYNGMLIPQKLSFRKGKVYKFREQSPCSINYVRDEIMKNLHEVAKKITQNKLDILEFILRKTYSNPNYYINENSGYNAKAQLETERNKIIRFPELKIIENSKDGVAEKRINLFFINGVAINDDGEVQFFYEYKDEKGELKAEFPHLENNTFAGLFIKFEKEIKENTDVFIQELKTEIANGEKEVAEICDKGQNQLALCELTNTENKFGQNN